MDHSGYFLAGMLVGAVLGIGLGLIWMGIARDPYGPDTYGEPEPPEDDVTDP